MLSSLPEAGDYFSTFKIVLILVLVLPWLYASTWINKDSVRVHMPQWLWSALALGSGAVALLLWLLLSWYAVGLALYLAIAGSTLTAYVMQRNRRVVAKARVFTPDHFKRLLKREKRQTVEAVQRIKMYDALGRPVFPPPAEQVEGVQAYNFAQHFLHNVILYRASDVDLSPAGDRAGVKFVVDGVAQQRPAVNRGDAETVIDYVKSIAGMNVQDKRRPQTGKLVVEAGAVTVDVTVSTAGTTGGQRMQLRIVQEAARTNVEDLGMPDDVRQRMEKLNSADTGLIIVSGLRGSGVTSTLYSLLRCHDAYMKHLMTLESSHRVDLENVTQVPYKDQSDLAAQLTRTLRRDPDVVMVDRCEVAQVARLIHETAETKNVLLGALAENAFVALARWVKTVGDARIAIAPLKAVTCQALLRKLCPSCREEYAPARDLLAKLNLPAQKIGKFYRAPTGPRVDEKGRPIVCATCRGMGYFGRIGAFELLELSDEIRELVVAQASLKNIKAACRMQYLQKQALQKVIDGVTSIEEVVRVSKTMQ